MAWRRRLPRGATDEAEEEPDFLLDEAERAIFAIAEDRIRVGFVPLRDLVQTSFQTIEKLQQHKGMVTGVPTGFADFDELTNGLHAGQMIVLAARPSMGKTSFVLNIAQHVGTQGDLVVVFHVHEMKTVVVAIEKLVLAVLDMGALDLLGGLVTLGNLNAVADPAHIDLGGGGALARVEALGVKDDVELTVEIDDIPLAERRSDDLHDRNP